MAADTNGASLTNGVEQYKPELLKSSPGDFMRPAMRTRGNSTTANGVGVQAEDTRICVVMVGLPARGKSLIAQKGMRWLCSVCPLRFIHALLLTSCCSRSLSWLAQHHCEVLQRG